MLKLSRHFLRNSIPAWKSCVGYSTPFNLRSPRFICNTQLSDADQKLRDQIILELNKIEGTDNKSLFDANTIKQMNIHESKVEIQLELTPQFPKIRKLIIESMKNVPDIGDLKISSTPSNIPEQKLTEDIPSNLADVKHIIAVSSCKGGVGKSTVSVNLAFSLQKLGKKVGLFDADIYGPSLPTMLSPEDTRLLSTDDDPPRILPIMFSGIKCTSFGFANTEGGSATIRGPLASSICTQLATQTEWGELDFLVIDLPPGTGDIQISLCQQLSIGGAVIVTTPQKLSFVDVVKGIEMLEKLNVPTIAAVENMGCFMCQECGALHRPFGRGYLDQIVKQYGITNSFEVPVTEDLSKYSDIGQPPVLVLPDSADISRVFLKLAQSIVDEMELLESHKQAIPDIYFNSSKHAIVMTDPITNKPEYFSPAELRKECACALCIDEFSGEKILDRESVNEQIHPIGIRKMGNYAIGIDWSDAHNSIYTYAKLRGDSIPKMKE